MNPTRRAIAATQALLISPAILFMCALILRQMSPLQHEPAYTSQQIVMWYAGRMWTLWVLLITLPLGVVVTGCLTFLRSWRKTRTSPECAAMVRRNSRRSGDAVCRCPDTDGRSRSRNCRRTHGRRTDALQIQSAAETHAMHYRLRYLSQNRDYTQNQRSVVQVHPPQPNPSITCGTCKLELGTT